VHADARSEGEDILARSQQEAESTRARSQAEAEERRRQLDEELDALREQAEARMRELQTDTEHVEEERRELLADIRLRGSSLLELADAAVAREPDLKPDEPEPADEVERAGVEKA